MKPFCNPLAQRERAAIRAHAKHLRRRANALFALAVLAVCAALPFAYVVGMCAGTWACR